MPQQNVFTVLPTIAIVASATVVTSAALSIPVSTHE